MLFLVQADLKLQWINLSISTVLLVELAGADVGALSWEEVTEKHVIEDVVRLALRHGHRCSRGLVVSAAHVSDLKRSEDLRSTLATVQSRHRPVPGSGWLLDGRAPGVTEQRRHLDERVIELTNESIARADRKRFDLLGAPVNEQLLRHWQRMSAYLPEPC